jgi:hypothetical protein
MAMASRMLTQRFERVPSVMPARRPAWDRSWHGVPPLMMFTGSIAAQSIFVMSPRLGMWGYRWARILDGAAANSLNATACAPNTASTAMPRPLYPAHSSMTVSCLLRLPKAGPLVKWKAAPSRLLDWAQRYWG